jgi:hypothetical protein
MPAKQGSSRWEQTEIALPPSLSWIIARQTYNACGEVDFCYFDKSHSQKLSVKLIGLFDYRLFTFTNMHLSLPDLNLRCHWRLPRRRSIESGAKVASHRTVYIQEVQTWVGGCGSLHVFQKFPQNFLNL